MSKLCADVASVLKTAISEHPQHALHFEIEVKRFFSRFAMKKTGRLDVKEHMGM